MHRSAAEYNPLTLEKQIVKKLSRSSLIHLEARDLYNIPTMFIILGPGSCDVNLIKKIIIIHIKINK